MRVIEIQGSQFEDAEIEPLISLPAKKEITVFSHTTLEGLKPSEKRRKMILNKHLLPYEWPVEGKYQLPKVQPYQGDVPDVFIPYSARVPFNAQYKGVYCNIDDAGFNSTWTQPLKGLEKVSKYMVAVAPDNTLWVDGLFCENLEQTRRNRLITCFWQHNNVKVIQCASWGNAETIKDFAFDGLAESSWTAIGHQRIGNRSEQRLFRYAVSALVEAKSPLGLLVFGAPLNFDPGVPVLVKPSFISKLRKL